MAFNSGLEIVADEFKVLHILAVSSAYQRKGLGTMLLKPCLGAAGKLDCHLVSSFYDQSQRLRSKEFDE